MSYCIIDTTRCQQQNIDALNRVATYATADAQNGTAFNLAWNKDSSGNFKDEAFVATIPSTDFANVWVAVSPEVNKLFVGKTWGGLDPRNFVNLKGEPMDVVKLVSGDIIKVSKDFFKANYDPGTVTSATVVELGADGWSAKASSTASYAGITLKIGAKTYFTVANAGIGTEQVDAWYLEVA